MRRSLLNWFAKHARELPWRSDPTPYRVWVSEIMLQQTQVATVLPYYARFMKSFPTVQELATADEQILLSHWEGLGYYRRARSLHAAAKLIMADHGGEFPLQFDDVLALPGVGRYTAGAILSISDGQRQPILEGNTQRVFSRWIALRGTPADTSNNRLLWQVAEKMLPRKDAGSFNQAAMELGALVCTPKEPSCDQCPVASACCAHQAGLEKEIPGKVTRVAYENRTEYVLVVQRPAKKSDRRSRRGLHRSAAADLGDVDTGQQQFLVRPLPEGGRWAGLWDFPRTTQASLGSITEAVKQLSVEVGVNLVPGIRLTTMRHAVTKYRISLQVFQADLLETGENPGKPWKYVSLADLAEMPMSVTGRKIVKILNEDSQLRLPMS
ncbi:MAG: A/G-specific adenine glycosylase [Planctomycetaceae bacterium TMED240]|nr:A/G-specific adenine glycosylase [Rhodopirellula sp.]OUX05260.1 MAG: A/G-specific adenine glycosylase [Planctomycetaceae bacterium TMED240]